MNYLEHYRTQARRLPKGSYNLISLVRNYVSWKASMQPGKNPLNDGLPWMTFDAIHFLKRNLKSNMTVFEYGSGGSSVFFSRLAGEVISVEHNSEWYFIVKERVTAMGINNWNGILIEPENSTNIKSDTSDPDSYSTSDEQNKNFSFEKYVKTIDQYPDNYFDLISIDGRARPSCLKHSVSKVKKNGYILLDNSDRPNYQRAISLFLTNGFFNEIDDFGVTSYSLDLTKTIIRRKLF